MSVTVREGGKYDVARLGRRVRGSIASCRLLHGVGCTGVGHTDLGLVPNSAAYCGKVLILSGPWCLPLINGESGEGTMQTEILLCRANPSAQHVISTQ